MSLPPGGGRTQKPTQEQDAMTAEEESSIVIPQKALPFLMVILIGSATGLGGYSAWKTNELATEPAARPDSWTGTDARRQAYEIRSEMRAESVSIRTLVSDLERRVDGLESRCAVVTDRLDRILLILDGNK